MKRGDFDPAAVGFADSLLTVKEVAAFLRCGVATVWKAVKAGMLPPPVYVGSKSPRWWRSEIEAAPKARGRHGG